MDANKKKLLPLKIAVIGRSKTGKSCVTFRYVSNKFLTDHEITIEDTYIVKKTIDDIDCQLHIIDTAGEKEFDSMLDSWINTAEAFILVYNIDNKDSYDEMKAKYQRISYIKGKEEKYCITVLGNKCDMESRRVVEKRDAEKFCDQHKIFFLEGSAKDNINIKESFLSVARNMLRVKYPEEFIGKKEEEKKKTCYCF